MPYAVRKCDVCPIGYKLSKLDIHIGDVNRFAKGIAVGLERCSRHSHNGYKTLEQRKERQARGLLEQHDWRLGKQQQNEKEGMRGVQIPLADRSSIKLKTLKPLEMLERL